MSRNARLRRRQRTRGQSLVLVALVLPFLIAFILTCIEVGERFWERAAIEDALQQATRSSVQSFQYRAFAQNSQQLDAVRVVDVAKRTFAVNLTGLRGPLDPAATVVAQVTWQVHPNGGTCTFPNGRAPVTAPTPMVCATVSPRMTGLLGWGTWVPQIDAASTLDAVP